MDYFIFSLRWTKENHATWWGPNNSGYTSIIDNAGRYSREDVEAMPDYYNNGITTIAVPCADVERAAQRVVFDYGFLKLLEPRRLTHALLDEEGDECDSCGRSSPPTYIGLRVLGGQP